MAQRHLSAGLRVGLHETDQRHGRLGSEGRVIDIEIPLDDRDALGNAGAERFDERRVVIRIEERLASVEQKLDRMALRSELLELKAQVANLEERIAELEIEI